MESPNDQLIEKYLAGSCSESEIEQILQWLNASEKNEKELFDWKIWGAKNSFNQLSETAEIQCAYRELVRLNQYKKELERRITKKIALKFFRYAASVLLFIGLSASVWWWIGHRVGNSDLLSVVVGEGEAVQQMTLGDSTRVWLFENSRIEFPNQFDQHSRTVRIEGKAYFEVFKDAGRPFIVDVGDYRVQALGTAFEVTTYKNKKQFEVILVEGLAQVSNPDRSVLSQVRPGEQMKINMFDRSYHIDKVDAEVYTSWRKGILEFDGMTFPEIAKVLERYYGVRIVLENPGSMNQELVGSLNLKRDIYEMMKTIGMVVPIHYNIAVDTYVYIKNK